jgi:hypothetical protein
LRSPSVRSSPLLIGNLGAGSRHRIAPFVLIHVIDGVAGRPRLQAFCMSADLASRVFSVVAAA